MINDKWLMVNVGAVSGHCPFAATIIARKARSLIYH